MIAPVDKEQWELFEPIFRAEFNSALPNPKRSKILGRFGDNGLGGFILAENLVYAGLPYVLPDYRHTGVAEELFDHVQERCRQEGASLVSIGSHPKIEKLLARRGLWKVEGDLWRVNYGEEAGDGME